MDVVRESFNLLPNKTTSALLIGSQHTTETKMIEKAIKNHYHLLVILKSQKVKSWTRFLIFNFVSKLQKFH